MKVITLVNPSARLLELVRVVESGYKQTCHTHTCTHSSHEPGYSWAKVEIEDSFEEKIHTYPATERSYATTCLRQEYVEDHTAKGIPENAPRWAWTLDSRCDAGSYCNGEGVDVVFDEGFTVVKLMAARNSTHKGCGWYAEIRLFATRDGKADDSKVYRQMRFSRTRREKIATYVSSGFRETEAERLFKIGNEPWTHEFTPRLLENAARLRDLRGYLRDLSLAVSRQRQQHFASGAGLISVIAGLSCPQTQAFALKALWVFYGEKGSNGEREELPDLRKSDDLVSLADAFAAIKVK
jgi:hypothetical protein